MLVVSNLNKTYQAKSKASHHALKDLNIEFGDKGFVFILGKSGSGKSTLLNVVGGLDNFDSGDIIIKNKSSKKFRAKDWDSYRNTYLGFVFQDYNIIENYSVAKNIGLALEFQGYPKKKIHQRVAEILSDVDLEALGKRKPNELSGGQKQRVAIARALVKNPEIILADEPTGNLDQDTGEQILNILRRLAETKLVIMVSHDKESAYKYADRIIMMSDGSIVSDEFNEGGLKYISDDVDYYRTNGEITNVVRIPGHKEVTSENLEHINNIVKEDSIVYIPISKGRKLTERDLKIINQLTGAEDIYLPIAKTIDDIQGTNNQKYSGRDNPAKLSLGKFVDTFKLIKSRLPIKNSIKMALSAIWRKKVKIFFSAILFLASLTLFGFSETVTRFDFSAAVANSYELGNIQTVSLSKREEVLGWERTEKTKVQVEKEDLAKIISKYGSINVGYLYNFKEKAPVIGTSNDFVSPKQLLGFFEVDALSDFDLTLITGTYPEDVKSVMLTDFVVDYIIEEDVLIDNYEEFIGYKLLIGNEQYIVTGIVDTDYEKFTFLNDVSASQLKDYTSEIGIFSNQNDSVYSRVIVNNEFYSKYVDGHDGFSQIYSFQVPKEDAENVWDTEWLGDAVFKFSSDIINHPMRDKFLFVENGFTGLKDHEILVGINTIAQLNGLDHDDLYAMINPESSNVYDKLIAEGLITDKVYEVSTVSNEDWVRLGKKDYKIVGVFNFDMYRQYLETEIMHDYIKSRGFEFERHELEMFESNIGHYNYSVTTKYMYLKLKELNVDVISEQRYWETNNGGDYYAYITNLAINHDITKVSLYTNMWSALVFNENNYATLNPYSVNKANSAVLYLPINLEENRLLFDELKDAGYRHNTLSGAVLGVFNDFVDTLAIIFRYVSLGLAGFSVLLMFTNISQSVLAAKKEIGTLRALGARGKDVAFIFVTEALIIATITCLVANLVLIIISTNINLNLSTQLGIPLTIFNPSLFIVLELFGLAYIVVTLASFLPVKGVTIMKPIDAIKDK